MRKHKHFVTVLILPWATLRTLETFTSIIVSQFWRGQMIFLSLYSLEVWVGRNVGIRWEMGFPFCIMESAHRHERSATHCGDLGARVWIIFCTDLVTFHERLRKRDCEIKMNTNRRAMKSGIYCRVAGKSETESNTSNKSPDHVWYVHLTWPIGPRLVLAFLTTGDLRSSRSGPVFYFQFRLW